VSTVAVSGASGLLGKRLRAALVASGRRVLRLVRSASPGAGEIGWDPAGQRLDPAALADVEAVVHLSGEPVAGARWSTAKKRAIVESRIASTQLVAETLARLPQRPAFLCASAIGVYGDRGDAWLDETSAPGTGFLAETCVAWERACEPARAAGLRVANLRFGVALERGGGVLGALLPLFKLGLGGPVGPGTQWQSWIAAEDAVAAVLHILESAALCGPIDVVAPAPVTNADFTRALARAVHRPAFLRVPAGVLRLALGEAADELLLASQRARPAKLEASGFRFAAPDLATALRRILG
jgi:uncharacterized protein